MGKTNIRKIAERAGVSTAAVSYVLNGKSGVSEETRKRILQVIREENYTPNMNSRRLIYRRSYNIFLVTDAGSRLTNLFYSSVMGALAEESDIRGYSLVLSGRKDDFRDSAAYQAVRQTNADGLIFLFDPDEDTLSILREEHIPFVVLDSHKVTTGYPCVRADYRKAAATAVTHLISLGHRRIGLLGRGKIPDYHASICAGYRDAMEAAGLPVQEELILSGGEGRTAAAETLTQMMELEPKPTAVMCAGDLSAVAAMTRARKLGYSIPEELSFVSVDDLPIAELYHPALTTVRIDAAEMAHSCAELLEAQIEQNEEPHEVVIASQNLIERESACPPRQEQ